MNDLPAFVRSLPEAGLHVHPKGCIAPEQVMAVERRNGLRLFKNVEEEHAAHDVENLRDFPENLARV